MDGLGIIVIIVLGIIISAVSAAAKKKTSESSEGGDAPRRPVMSDIQRAFQMMSGLDNEEDERKRDTIFSNFKAPEPPPATSSLGNAAPRVSLSDYEGIGGSEGLADYEGLSDYGKAASGSIRGDSPIEREAGVYKYAAASEKLKEVSQSITDNEASTLTELKSDDMGHRLDESVELADIAETNRENMLAGRHRAKPALKLFESQSDYVKAVIFSEVLAKRSPVGRRAARR